jgi:hypothetical protein
MMAVPATRAQPLARKSSSTTIQFTYRTTPSQSTPNRTADSVESESLEKSQSVVVSQTQSMPAINESNAHDAQQISNGESCMSSPDWLDDAISIDYDDF